MSYRETTDQSAIDGMKRASELAREAMEKIEADIAAGKNEPGKINDPK